MEKRKCFFANCGAEFTPSKKKQIYCSTKCRTYAYRESLNKLDGNDLPKTTNVKVFKPEQNLYQTYISEINSATSIESIEITMSSVKLEKKLTYAEKRVIEQIAKQKSTQFDF